MPWRKGLAIYDESLRLRYEEPATSFLADFSCLMIRNINRQGRYPSDRACSREASDGSAGV
ncbi:MAG: hypothetical protein ABTQ25_15210 [Nitrosomonas ureae]